MHSKVFFRTFAKEIIKIEFMKNIFLLPTEKESNLAIIDNKLFQYDPHVRFLSGRGVDGIYTQNQFIYITNDEDIKEEDWCMSLCDDESYEEIYQCKDVELVDEEDKKIILTNDPSLIEDGVQEVNSSFLSFYAENTPDCVEVLSEIKCYDKHGFCISTCVYDTDYTKNMYYLKFVPKSKLEITKVSQLNEDGTETDITDKPELWYLNNPIEYSKLLSEFETLEGITSNMFDGKDWARFDRFVKNREKNTEDNWQFERSSGYAGYRNKVTKEWIYEEEYFKLFLPKENKEQGSKTEENIINQWLEKNGNPEIAKQVEREAEELEIEEASERYIKDGQTYCMEKTFVKQGFVSGAKWKSENSCSKEEVFELLDVLLNNNMCSHAGDDLIKQFKNKQNENNK